VIVAHALLAAAVDVLEGDPALAARLARVLAAGQPADLRIPIGDVTAHGAPSARWCSARRIVRGPRGARYVLAAELATALEASTPARRPPAIGATVALKDDAHAAVVDLAARRERSAR